MATYSIHSLKLPNGDIVNLKDDVSGYLTSASDTITSWYGTCSTTASTAQKDVTCSGYTLNTGNIVGVLFSTANTAATPTLKVGSTAAKSIYVGASTPNSTTNVLQWSANTMVYFMYDGTYYRYLCAEAAASVDQPRGASVWYGTSSTSTNTRAKEAAVTNFVLTKGAIVAIDFSYGSTAALGALTLNVNSTGAKAIYKNGTATSSSNTLDWGSGTVLFVYNGTGYAYLGNSRNTMNEGTMTELRAAGDNSSIEAYVTPFSGEQTRVPSITTSGRVHVNHLRPTHLTERETQGIYPFSVNRTGHLTSTGDAVTIPTGGSTSTNITTSASSAGTATTWARSDHTHQLTSQNIIDALGYTPGSGTGGDPNQNAFSNVLVGDVTIAAETVTDTLELIAGTGISLTPNATNDSVTIAASGILHVNFTFTSMSSGTCDTSAYDIYQAVQAGKLVVAHCTMGAMQATLQLADCYIYPDEIMHVDLYYVEFMYINQDTSIYPYVQVSMHGEQTTTRANCTVNIYYDELRFGHIEHVFASGALTATPDTDGDTVTITHNRPATSPAKNTSALYPITIDEFGHILSAGTGIVLNATNPSKFLREDGTWQTVTAGVSDVKVGTTGSTSSIVSNGVAELITNTAYNSSTNKIATMSDVPSVTSTYSSTGTTAVTGTAVNAALQTLDSSITATTGQAISAITITDGKITSSSKIDVPAKGTWYGTSSTTASTSEKAVTCSGYALQSGNVIGVLFSTANTASTPTLNVNSTGAKTIYVGGNTALSDTNPLKWSANTMLYFLYDGTYYRYITSVSSAGVIPSRGANTWYGTSSTTATTAAKVSTIDNFVLSPGTLVSIKFSTANTYADGAITLNVSSTGAKNVYYNGAVTSSSNQCPWLANDTITFMYDGTGYQFISRSSSDVSYIDGVYGAHVTNSSLPGKYIVRYGTCSVGASNATKTVTLTNGTPYLNAGTHIFVNFSNKNTAASPTLNVNSTGARTIKPDNAILDGICELVYDGTYWQVVASSSAASSGVTIRTWS